MIYRLLIYYCEECPEDFVVFREGSMLLVSIPPLGIKKTMALSKLLSAFTSSRCISLIAAESIIAMILTLFFASISLR